jgi:plasmid stabilization system protein ParE
MTADDEREALALAGLDSERLRQIAEWLRMEQGHEETARRVDLIADRHDRLAGFHRQGPITDEWELRIENRIHYRYGVNSGTYSAWPYGVTASHDEQKQRLEDETSGPVDVVKRESRTVLVGPWEPVEAARAAGE